MSQIWTLVTHDLRRRYRSLIIWGVVIGGLGALYVALYPSMSSMLDEYMQSAPESMRQYMGGVTGPITPEQWMEMEFTGSIIPIALPFLVMLIGARAVAGREERKTLDLLLSNPLRRNNVIAGTALTMALALAGVLLLAWILTYIATLVSGVDLGAGHLAQGLVVLWPFGLFFGSLALLLSTFMRRGAFATTIAAVVMVAMYVIDGLAQVSKTIEPIRVVSLVYQLGHPMQGDFPWTAVLVMLAAVVIFVAAAMASFARRDVYT
jgi:ABC-2 type transport system permease protein